MNGKLYCFFKGKSVESAEPSPDLCSLTRFHQCHICSRVVRHDYRSIYHHLSCHKIDIEKYSATYRDKIICELREKKMEYVIEREEEIKNSPTLEEYLKRRKVILIYNRCFTCVPTVHVIFSFKMK